MSKNPSYCYWCLFTIPLADVSSSNHVPSASLKENELKRMSRFSLPPEINSFHKPGSEFIGFLPRLWGADFMFVRKLCCFFCVCVCTVICDSINFCLFVSKKDSQKAEP